MPNGIFNQQIETQAASQQVISPVTANPTAAAIEGFGGLASTGVKLGVAFNEQSKLQDELSAVDSELKGFSDQLGGIDQAIKSGGNKAALQMRARAALKSAIATSPILKNSAEALYANYFGGGGTGGTGTSGAFSLTPRETAAQKLGAEIADLELLGYSNEKATLAVQGKRAAEIAKTQADMLSSQAKVELYQVGPVADAMLRGNNVQFQTNLDAILKDSGGTISTELKLSLGRDVERNRAEQLSKLSKATLNPDGTRSISSTDYQEMVDRINSQADNFAEIIKDNSALNFYEEKGKVANAKVQLAALDNFPQMALMRKALGDQGAGEIMAALSSGDPARFAFVKTQFPELGVLMSNEFNFVENALVKGTGKLFDTEAKPTQVENALVGSMMGSNAGYAMKMLKAVDVDRLRNITKMHPQAIASTYKPSTASLRKDPKVVAGISEMQRGSLDNLNELYRSEFGSFPTGLEITLQTRDRPYAVVGERPRRIQVNSVEGKLLSQDMVNIVADIFRSIEANPDSIPEGLRDKGLSTAQIATAWINSGMDTEALKYYEPFLETVTEEGRDFNSSGGRTASVGREKGNQSEGKK